MGNKNKINICVIPAAGRGSRWAPVSGYLPKEMLPLIDRPVIEWVVDEAVAAGCSEIIIIINKQKKIIKEYFSKNERLKKKAVKFYFIDQPEPLGITHALSLTQKIIGNRAFAVALPDLPTMSKKPVLGQLIKAVHEPEHIISFSSFPTGTLQNYSECLVEPKNGNLLKILHFCPKQKNTTPHHTKNKTRMSGRYVFSPQIFKIIKKLTSKKIENEVNEVIALKTAMEDGQKIYGLEIQGHTYDTGTPAGYVRANTAFFKKRFSKKL